MLVSPTTRNVLSSICATMTIILRMAAGFKNGMIPSITSTSASAVRISFHILLNQEVITLE